MLLAHLSKLMWAWSLVHYCSRLRAVGVALVLSGGAWGGLACQTPQPATRQPDPGEVSAIEKGGPQEARLFAWEAKVGESYLTLLGSVHVGRGDLYPLDSRLEGRFDASDAVVFELDLARLKPGHAARVMRDLGSLSPGETLADKVSSDTMNGVRRALATEPGAVKAANASQPWFVSTLLTMRALRRAGFKAEWGIDEHFRLRAREATKTVIGLETLEEQLSLLSGLDGETQEILLRSTLEDLDEQGAQLSAAFELWGRGDAVGLDQTMLQPLRTEHPQLFARIFAVRNHQMVSRLLEISKQPGRYFVVVGAGHLIGQTGIVDLFSRLGIVARQL